MFEYGCDIHFRCIRILPVFILFSLFAYDKNTFQMIEMLLNSLTFKQNEIGSLFALCF